MYAVERLDTTADREGIPTNSTVGLLPPTTGGDWEAPDTSLCYPLGADSECLSCEAPP